MEYDRELARYGAPEAEIAPMPRLPPPNFVTFSAFTPICSPYSCRPSSHFSNPKPIRPIKPHAVRQPAWVSLQGRLIGAEEASSARTIGLGLSREQAVSWELFSPIHRILIVAVVAVAVANSKRDRKIYQLRKCVELKSYEDEPIPKYHHIEVDSQPLSQWEEYGLGENRHECIQSDYTRENVSSRKALPPGLVTSEPRSCRQDDTKSVTSSCTNHITLLQTYPAADMLKSRRRNSLGDFKSVNSQPAINSQTTKTKGMIFLWLFPRLKKKDKSENSPPRPESEEVSQVFKDLGIVSVEMLKRELIEANQKRDAAMKEVREMRSSFGELKQKLESLEAYCEALKRALRQAVSSEKLGNLSKRGKLVNRNGTPENTLLPVSEEALIEGFLQIVSEPRASVKHFCKSLIAQIEETDAHLTESLNLLLWPYKLSLNSKYSKAVLHHLEATVNQTLYQDFENCVFLRNGSPKLLDPQQECQAQFSLFVSLRNLSWNQVLKKGTKYYSEEFSMFCDQKMSCIITTLNWARKWPEPLLQSFFVAAKLDVNSWGKHSGSCKVNRVGFFALSIDAFLCKKDTFLALEVVPFPVDI
ncbi:hypothetical protein Ancab_000117 [Ancistrocladus abbreviatus]